MRRQEVSSLSFHQGPLLESSSHAALPRQGYNGSRLSPSMRTNDQYPGPASDSRGPEPMVHLSPIERLEHAAGLVGGPAVMHAGHTYNAGSTPPMVRHNQVQPMGLTEQIPNPYMQDLSISAEGNQFQPVDIDTNGARSIPVQYNQPMLYGTSPPPPVNQSLERPLNSAPEAYGQPKVNQSPSPKTTKKASTKTFKCKFCSMLLPSRESRIAHAKTHTEPKPYSCTVCEKRFSQAGLLNVHMRTHTGEKPYKCLVCDRRFSRSGNVVTHMRVHEDSKPFSCAFCGKRFSQRVNMELHTRVHTGVKPYKCGECNRAFTSSSNMRRHWRQIHPNRPEPALRTTHLTQGMPEKAFYTQDSGQNQFGTGPSEFAKLGVSNESTMHDTQKSQLIRVEVSPAQMAYPMMDDATALNPRRDQQQYGAIILAEAAMPRLHDL